jgi:hypothetical protein
MAHDVTQHVSVSIKNNLTKGEIILQNLALLRGQPYKEGDRPSLIPAEDVNKIVIRSGETKKVSFCGSAAYGAGVEGTLDLYNDQEGQIASLYWNGPYNQKGNLFEVTNADTQHYEVIVGSIPSKGILGDVSVTVTATDEG